MASPLLRADLSDDEFADLQAKSKRTGISIARLVGDAIRKVHLKPAKTGGKEGH